MAVAVAELVVWAQQVLNSVAVLVVLVQRG
jgi:hypothetical protein